MRHALALSFLLSLGACAGSDDNIGGECDGADCVCTDADECDISCGDGCNAVCDRSQDCIADCGDDCAILCRDSDTCSATCDHGCTATCDNVRSCTIDCGEDCEVTCLDSDSCDVRLTTGAATCEGSHCVIQCDVGDPVDCGGNRFACDPAWC